MNHTEKIKEKVFLIRLNSFDSEVFIEIYRFYVDRIYRYLYFRVKNKEDAEDMTSDVFMRTWEYVYKKQNTITYLNAFLFQAARNLITDYYRKSKDESALEEDNALDLLDETQQNLGLKFDQEKKYSEIEKSLSLLKEEYRDVILLYYIENFSCSEISKIMNRSKGAVRILLHRAMKELRKNIHNSNV